MNRQWMRWFRNRKLERRYKKKIEMIHSYICFRFELDGKTYMDDLG